MEKLTAVICGVLDVARLAGLVALIILVSRVSYADEVYGLGETSHQFVGNRLAYSCWFYLRNDTAESVTSVSYRVRFFDTEGDEILPTGLNNPGTEKSAIAAVSMYPMEIRRVYSPLFANYEGQVVSCEVEVLSWSGPDGMTMTF